MMRQIAQHLQSGKVSLEHVPLPTCSEGAVLVRVVRSLVSVGTERASLESGKQSLLERARKHPDQVRTVLDMLRRNGIGATIATIRARLDAFRPLGYSAAGIVVESRCPEYAAGDRVACAGAQYAHHAEYIAVPKHLVARIPESVSFDEAAYTTLGAIALQGIRQASPRLGETVLVIGLGLLGQLTCALLRANGCRVIGMDIRSEVFDAARASGCDLVLPSERGSLPAIMSATNSHGADCVIITASTPSNAPLELAIAAARKKAAIVVVGAVGMNVPRGPFYEKELELKIATSYGPGRYDPLYEERGVDYPFAYVRWTEQRNMAAFLDALARRTIAIEHLTTHRIPFEEAERAYQLISEPGTERVLGVLLCYPAAEELPATRAVEYPVLSQRSTAPIGIGFLGAGGFAQSTLLPILRRLGVHLESLATRSPLSAHSVARHFGFRRSTTDAREVIADPRVELVVCATRHDTHAEYVCAALDAGKAVFVEKPLCRTPEELAEIDRRIARWGERVMVGFNRRFSPAVRAIAEHFAHRVAPMAISYRFNAGALPPSSWIQDPTQGGRIIGEACHALDVMVFLTGSLPVEVVAYALPPIAPGVLHDTVTALIRFADGSIGTLQYWSNGDRAIEKEWCEVSCQERSAILENFHHIRLARDGKVRRYRFGAGKGHRKELEATVAAVTTGSPMPIPYEQLRAVTLATFAIVESLRTGGRPVLLESLDPRTQSANR